MFDNNDFNYLEFKRLYENGVGELDFIMIFNNSKTEHIINPKPYYKEKERTKRFIAEMSSLFLLVKFSLSRK